MSKKLKAEVADKFQLIGVEPGKYQFGGFGEIDLTELTLERAENLVKLGFTHLKPVAKKAATKDDDK